MVLKLDYPEALPDALNETPEEFEAEARMAMAVKLYEMRRISSGVAAQLAGVGRVDFLLSLHKYNVSAINESAEEISSDIENV